MYSIIDSEKCFSNDIAYRLKKGEFDVCEPYFRNSKSQQRVSKKQKTEHKPSNADLETKRRHEQVLQPMILGCLEQIQAEWPWKDKKTPNTVESSSEKNMIDFPSMQVMVEAAHFKFTDPQEETLSKYEFNEPVSTDMDVFSVFHTLCVNESKTETKLMQLTPEATYLIPPNSTFLMGSLENTIDSLGSYVKELGGADLIVMDPPWPNKSVHRSSRYETQDIYDLFRIPIPEMQGSKDTLVAVWVTNKPKFRNFILNKLFPAWQLECAGEWIWLKMTTQAEPIFPIDSEHKKPYEQLILGRPKQLNKVKERADIPKTHIITSIPSKKHSRKPPLEDVLSAYISEKEPVKVELFARCLLPGWISWGNECLKFQHLDYFDKA